MLSGQKKGKFKILKLTKLGPRLKTGWRNLQASQTNSGTKQVSLRGGTTQGVNLRGGTTQVNQRNGQM